MKKIFNWIRSIFIPDEKGWVANEDKDGNVIITYNSVEVLQLSTEGVLTVSDIITTKKTKTNEKRKK